MSAPMMPYTAPPSFLSRAQAAEYTFTNFTQVLSSGRRSGQTLLIRSSRTDRVNAEYTSSTGIFSPSPPRPATFTNGCTILFFGGRNSTSNATVSNASVNGNAVTLTSIYNGPALTTGTVYMSCFIGYAPEQVDNITTAQASFPVGGGGDVINVSSIYILPGRWTAGAVTVTSGTTAGTIAVAENEMVAYSCGNDIDSNAANVSFTAGTLIGCSKVNWYSGVEHGLMYRTTAGNVTLTPVNSLNNSFLRMFKLSYVT